MNLSSLRFENPGWDLIQQVAEEASKNIDPLLSLLRDYDPEDSLVDIDDEWPIIHAVRILGYQRNPEVIPELARIINSLEEMGDEDSILLDEDSILLNDAQVALERFDRPDDFPIIWEEFLKYRGTEGGHELLRVAAACRVPTPELRRQLLAYFEEDPVMASWAMADSADIHYLGALDAHLTWLAPFVKYISFDRMSISEHDDWIECGSAWYKLIQIKEGRTQGRESFKPGLQSYYGKHLYPSKSKLEKMQAKHLAEVADEREALEKRFLAVLPSERAQQVPVIERAPGVVDERDFVIDAYLRVLSPTRVTASKIGRNEPCPCGSGRKFKQCCLRRQSG